MVIPIAVVLAAFIFAVGIVWLCAAGEQLDDIVQEAGPGNRF